MHPVERAILNVVRNKSQKGYELTPGDVRTLLEMKGVAGGEVRNALSRLVGRGELALDPEMVVRVPQGA